MPFQIVNAANGRPVIRHGEPVQFPDGAQAHAFLKQLLSEEPARPGIAPRQLKIKPVNDPAADDVWQERERQRMRQGVYVAAPFGPIGPAEWWESAIGAHRICSLEYANRTERFPPYNEAIKCHERAKHHYAHVSMADKTKLAYTPDSRHGVDDRQLNISPGGYLKKYFSDVLTHDQITEIVRDWQRRFDSVELKFARTPEEIVKIYQTGPWSCMSGRIDEYSSRKSGHHPCEVYGLPHSDITMAYIQNKGRITSRCLVWEAEKKHSRIYGDITLISRELKALGYVESPMYGAKVAKIEAGKSYVMAYVDDTAYATDDGDCFRLWDESKRSDKRLTMCRNNNGLADGRSDAIECDDCGDEHDVNDSFHVGGGHVCRNCIDDHYFVCAATGDYCNENDQSPTEVRISPNSRISGGWRTEDWGECAVERYAFYCEATKAHYHQSNAIAAEDGATISPQAVTDGLYVLHEGSYYAEADMADIRAAEAAATEQSNHIV